MISNAKDGRLLPWIDIETTGFTELDKQMVYQHRILEVAIVVTDEHFTIIDRFCMVAHHPREEVSALCDEVVTRMHSSSGLLAEVEASTNTLEQLERSAVDFLIAAGVSRKSAPMTGNGIGFDRMFIEAQMPVLNDHLHYRNLDVSAVKEFIKTIAPGHEPTKKLAHRAMDDILESIAEAKHYRDLLLPALSLESQSR